MSNIAIIMRSLSLYHCFVGIASIAVKITSRDAQVRVKQFIYCRKWDVIVQFMQCCREIVILKALFLHKHNLRQRLLTGTKFSVYK